MTRREQTAIINKLKKELRAIEVELESIAQELLDTEEVSTAYYTKVRSRVKKEYEAARKIFKEWAAPAFETIFADEARTEIARIKNIRAINVPGINAKDFINADRSRQSVASVLNDSNAAFQIGLESGMKTFQRLISVTQQVNITEREVNRAVGEGYIESGGTVKGAQRKLQEKLGEKITDGKTITISDKNGKERTYNLKYYAELVARTKTAEAQSQAVVNTALRVGSDLVQVTSHNTITPLCQEFEGKIFSISGTDPDFPALEEEPPYHPGCLHRLSVVFRGMLEQQGILEESIKFANGKTEEHPTREGHIPVSER